MATIQSIIDRVTFVTKDNDHVRWTLAEIAEWLNNAAEQIVSVHPRAGAAYHTLTLAAGPRQDIRTAGAGKQWVRLFELVCNMVTVEDESLPTGTTIRLISRPSLDAAFRSWRTRPATATAVKEYAVDEREPFTFDVNPPVAAGVKVLALATAKPTRCAVLNDGGTALADSDEEFPLAPGYDIPAVDYVLFRCFNKDANDPTYAARAGNHLQAFQLAMGVETRDAAPA